MTESDQEFVATRGADGSPRPEGIPPALPARVGRWQVVGLLAEDVLSVRYDAQEPGTGRRAEVAVFRPRPTWPEESGISTVRVLPPHFWQSSFM